MKKKKALGTGNKIFLFLLQQLVAVIGAVCIVSVIIGSVVKIGGNVRENYILNPFEYDMEFEDSVIFRNLLKNGIHDAMRMSVIKGQLETLGEFDGNKEIDVTAYVNRSEQLSGKYVTATYKLEDLLKWGKYGFEYTGTVFESVYDMQQFLSEKTTYTQYEGTYTSGFHPKKNKPDVINVFGNVSYWIKAEESVEVEAEIDENGKLGAGKTDIVNSSIETAEEYNYLQQEETVSASASDDITTDIIESDSTPSDTILSSGNMTTDAEVTITYAEDLYQTILTNRYRTVDGKTPEEITSTWEEYYQLCDNIAKASDNLYYNYQEYLQYDTTFKVENSNLIFCMEMLVDGETQYFTNAAVTTLSENTINNFFEKYAHTIYYSPYDMEYRTNTGIPEEYFLQLMNEYDYAYDESTKIWIAVDDSYLADDAFAKARDSYINFLPFWWEYVIGAIICAVMYLLILIILSCYTGRVREEGKEESCGIKATMFEMLPTEIWLLLCIIASGLVLIMFLFTIDVLSIKDMKRFATLKVTAIETAIASVTLSVLFYSFIRRCKVRNLWEASFICHIYRWFYEKILKKLFSNIALFFQSLPIAVRTLTPFVLFMLANMFFAVLLIKERNIIFLFALILLNSFVAWLLFLSSVDKQNIMNGIGKIRDGDLNFQLDTESMHGESRTLAEAVNSIGDGIRQAVETSMKDERLKADLITNVSHDIKTPLTSIINYVDLLKREAVQDAKIKGYIEVLDAKSQRLKQLTEDLVEASKISSGNITLHFEIINIIELINQAIGEFSEKFDTKDLQVVATFDSKAAYISADSRRMWRVTENLFNNIFKYAMPGTRIYIDGKETEENGKKKIVFSLKNISAQPLNINADELTERFIRGDVSRSTEGSGLGLSIAQNLTEAQHGSFEIYLDGDLFKVVLSFPKAEKPERKEEIQIG